MTEEQVVLVNAQNQQIGFAEKIYAHKLGLLHRAFSVFIVRYNADKLEILLQQRKADKYHCGALWTNTCCSHPRVNEDVVCAAQRRLYEEMGLHIKLQLLNSFIYHAEFANGLIEHEYDHVLFGYYNDEVININPAEVQNYKWVDLQLLKLSLVAEPDIYTPWLEPALEILQKGMRQDI